MTSGARREEGGGARSLGGALARASWGEGVAEAVGGRKRRRGEEESSEEEEGRGYYTSDGARKRRAGPGELEGDVGVIERVHLENFMCHGEFHWTPNSRVNFVTGANGSGKSSVLQGITLGLLGETRSTKRYAKISEFIRKGASRAVVQVTLRNAGEDAYKPELYGASITFQRTINESGTSAYLLKDQHLRDVVRKSREAKEECKRILDKFQIQVDSPVVILQQDEAKEMLKIESSDRLYKFFEKATLIKQCFDHYLAAQVGTGQLRDGTPFIQSCPGGVQQGVRHPEEQGQGAQGAQHRVQEGHGQVGQAGAGDGVGAGAGADGGDQVRGDPARGGDGQGAGGHQGRVRLGQGPRRQGEGAARHVSPGLT